MSNVSRIAQALIAGAYRMSCVINQHAKSNSGPKRKGLDTLMVLPGLFHSLYLNCRHATWDGSVNLAIVAILKNEGSYILEWVEYHRSIGFQKFFLYNNDSTDNVEELLAPYVHAGIVELIPWAGQARQMDAYNDALNKHVRDCEYIATIDLDEFISFGNQDTLAWLNQHIVNGVSGVGINWLIFGSSGRKTKPAGLVLESYTQRSKASFKNNQHTKTIVNPRRVLGYCNPHFAVPLLGYHAINVSDEPMSGPFSPSTQSDVPPLVYHYFCKSLEEFSLKRNRGMADNPNIRDQSDFTEHDRNEIKDGSMLPKAAEVKERLAYLQEHGYPYGTRQTAQ